MRYVDWFVTGEDEPRVTLALGLRPPSHLTPTEARDLAAELLAAADESERPDAAAVSAERAP